MYRQVLATLTQAWQGERRPILLILGLRQTGKSTLAETFCRQSNRPFVRFNFDLLSDINEFTSQDRASLALLADRYRDQIVIIDEVQKSPAAIGIIKHLYDTYHLDFLLTGSSEIKIRRGLGDSLAGRTREVRLFPLSLAEIDLQSDQPFSLSREFNNYDFNQQRLLLGLVFGFLPQIQNIPAGQHAAYLRDLTNNLLAKDILEIAGTKKPAQVFHLAKLLAFQIGQIVNFNELASLTSLSRITVINYVEIFEQMGIIVRAEPLSTNRREAITKRAKIYFTDLGIRNALIGDFNDFNNRRDQGPLLENAVFVGIKRGLEYGGQPYELGFFRSLNGSEIDIVKKVNGVEELFEVKVGDKPLRRQEKVTLISLKTAQKYLY